MRRTFWVGVSDAILRLVAHLGNRKVHQGLRVATETLLFQEGLQHAVLNEDEVCMQRSAVAAAAQNARVQSAMRMLQLALVAIDSFTIARRVLSWAI